MIFLSFLKRNLQKWIRKPVQNVQYFWGKQADENKVEFYGICPGCNEPITTALGNDFYRCSHCEQHLEWKIPLDTNEDWIKLGKFLEEGGKNDDSSK